MTNDENELWVYIPTQTVLKKVTATTQKYVRVHKMYTERKYLRDYVHQMSLAK